MILEAVDDSCASRQLLFVLRLDFLNLIGVFRKGLRPDVTAFLCGSDAIGVGLVRLSSHSTTTKRDAPPNVNYYIAQIETNPMDNSDRGHSVPQAILSDKL